MVAAYHLIWTAYGWWLPNDPRGSSSRHINSDLFAELGTLHYGRKRVQPTSEELFEFYTRARHMLSHALLRFSDEEIELLGESFAETCREQNYTCYACAILPDHSHVLIRKHRHVAETMLLELQNASRQTLIEAGRRKASHPVWGGPGWKVYLETRDDIERTIRYIVDNPPNAGRPAQDWDFVEPYNGWLPGRLSSRPPGRKR